LRKSYSDIVSYLNNYSIDVVSDIPKNKLIYGISSINGSDANFITFYSNSEYDNFINKTKAYGCLIKDMNKHMLPKNCFPIIVKDPYLTFAYLSNFFYPSDISNNSINKFSSIDHTFTKGKNIEIRNFVTIKKNVNISDNCIIGDNCVIGPNVIMGKNTHILPNTTISNTIIGDKCLIQSGTVIGDRGFGFTSNEKIEIRHIGNVIIGNNVHIGSNTAIDRATLESTIIEDNVRIDNLVQLAHNVLIGKNTIIAGQCGIAGSTKIGKNCKIGGQVGITGHIKIGDNVVIAAKSGVTKNIRSNSTVAGFPAIDIKLWKKIKLKQYRNLK
jgi:UDP-3-O-[3-hydroxymyristoyl] glucosamine N-acyltransferase